MGILNGQGIARAFRDKSKGMAGFSAVADETGTVLITNIPSLDLQNYIVFFPKCYYIK
jgi:hypothetical protein